MGIGGEGTYPALGCYNWFRYVILANYSHFKDIFARQGYWTRSLFSLDNLAVRIQDWINHRPSYLPHGKAILKDKKKDITLMTVLKPLHCNFLSPRRLVFLHGHCIFKNIKYQMPLFFKHQLVLSRGNMDWQSSLEFYQWNSDMWDKCLVLVKILVLNIKTISEKLFILKTSQNLRNLSNGYSRG